MHPSVSPCSHTHRHSRPRIPRKTLRAIVTRALAPQCRPSIPTFWPVSLDWVTTRTPYGALSFLPVFSPMAPIPWCLCFPLKWMSSLYLCRLFRVCLLPVGTCSDLAVLHSAWGTPKVFTLPSEHWLCLHVTVPLYWKLLEAISSSLYGHALQWLSYTKQQAAFVSLE